MSTRAKAVTPKLLTGWPLPEVGDSKYGRGEVIVVGGARRSPGAVILAGMSALRVGAGKLGIAAGESVALQIAVALPECGVALLPETPDGAVEGSGLAAAADDLASADAVLFGPGLDDFDEARAMLRDLPLFVTPETTVILDAFALGAVPLEEDAVSRLAGRLILTPNKPEAARLLDMDESDLDLGRDIPVIAARFDAVVSCYDTIATPAGEVFTLNAGGSGLGTSGSGDVLAGAITGFAARGATPDQAAVYGSWAHAMAGDALSERVGELGFLARELAEELPLALRSITG